MSNLAINDLLSKGSGAWRALIEAHLTRISAMPHLTPYDYWRAVRDLYDAVLPHVGIYYALWSFVVETERAAWAAYQAASR